MTHKNPLRDLHRFGVSVWYDFVSPFSYIAFARLGEAGGRSRVWRA